MTFKFEGSVKGILIQKGLFVELNLKNSNFTHGFLIVNVKKVKRYGVLNLGIIQNFYPLKPKEI